MADQTILIIDDEKDILRTLSIRLAPFGYRLLTAEDGLTGLEMARTSRPDLILLDIMIPKLDGFRLCRMLKFDERYKKIPIIMLTAKVGDIDKDIGIDVGADEYLTKPFDKQKLTSLIEKYLGREGQ